MNLYEKRTVIDYIWQYCKFYGNKLGDCEMYFEQDEGYTALILLFEVTENICKSVVGDYDSSFYNIVSELRKKDRISEEEAGFLSTNKWSVRKIRNLFAHANLMSINVVNNENGRNIYYPLSEQESCILLYDKISVILFNILLDIIKAELIVDLEIDFGKKISDFNIYIQELSAREKLQLLGWEKNDIDKVEHVVDENTLRRLADNSSNVNVLSAIFTNLISSDEEK